MDRTRPTDPADVLAGVGRHWGWTLAFGIVLALVLGIWLLVLGVMEITLAFQLRSAGHTAARIAAAT